MDAKVNDEFANWRKTNYGSKELNTSRRFMESHTTVLSKNEYSALYVVVEWVGPSIPNKYN